MLAFPGFTRSIMDSIEDDFAMHPMELICPRPGVSALSRFPGMQLAQPVIKDNKFNLALDLHQFKPEEVQVKFDDKNMLQVRGKREVKSDDGSSYEYREYVHHFSVPDSVQHDQLISKIDKHGLLKIEAPLKVQAVDDGHRHIPIEFVKKH